MDRGLSLKDGEVVIKFVRKTIEEWVRNNRAVHEWPEHPLFNDRRGILLSLHYKDSGKLHGRIGYPYPIKSVADVLARCAVSVCQDPRSPALKAADIKNVVAEVSVLSEPRAVLKPYEKNFDPLNEGLIVVRGAKRAMMMPADFDGKSSEAIIEMAKRAEMDKGLINDPLTKFYKFNAQTFFEKSPDGAIEEKVYRKQENTPKKTAKKRPSRGKKAGTNNLSIRKRIRYEPSPFF